MEQVKTCLSGKIEVLLVALALEVVDQGNNAERVLGEIRVEPRHLCTTLSSFGICAQNTPKDSKR